MSIILYNVFPQLVITNNKNDAESITNTLLVINHFVQTSVKRYSLNFAKTLILQFQRLFNDIFHLNYITIYFSSNKSRSNSTAWHILLQNANWTSITHVRFKKFRSTQKRSEANQSLVFFLNNNKMHIRNGGKNLYFANKKVYKLLFKLK